MGISTERYRAHILEFEAKFPNYRKAWPKHLYRHEPIQNVIEILRRGVLLSRHDATQNGVVQNDIAPLDIIGHREAAHNHARLYFRPLNPTQFHIEGIRKSADYYHGKHAGFLVMLLLNSERVLTDRTTQFSCGNMQSGNSTIQDGDDGFDKLDFDSIYHDSAYPSADTIRKRCAEVLPKSPFSLAETLEYIVVRTDADVNTLRYLLDRNNLKGFIPKVRKTTGGGIFFNRYTALDYVDTAPGRIVFKLRFSSSSGPISTQIELFELGGQKRVFYLDKELVGAKPFYSNHALVPGKYIIRVHLEKCFAHESVIEIQ